MNTCTKFDDIRPYNDDEVHGIIEKLSQDKMFMKIITGSFPQFTNEETRKIINSIRTKYDFQQKIAYPIFKEIADRTTVTLEITGLDHLLKENNYTFISNHRDIVLDAAWLNILLFEHRFNTTEIAIGDNLFVYDWISKIVRLNKSFVVKRGLSGRQMLDASLTLSEYIHYTVTQQKHSVWIAQREGRSKNSDDRTQESLLKMLTKGGGTSIRESLMELNIIPLSLSYEYDPCDYLKAQEFQLKRDFPDYRKTKEDDFLNMKTGLAGQKGRVHFRAGYSINPFLESLDPDLSKTDKLCKIAEQIDRQIHHNYHMYPCNYIAYDLLYGIRQFSTYYSGKEEKEFQNYLNTQIEKIKIPDKDTSFLRRKMLEMYSNPLKNKLIADEYFL